MGAVACGMVSTLRGAIQIADELPRPDVVGVVASDERQAVHRFKLWQEKQSGGQPSALKNTTQCPMPSGKFMIRAAE